VSADERLDQSWLAEPSSLVDPVGQVFRHEGRVLRGVRPPFVDEARRILECARRDDWFAHGLVPTWQTDLATPEYPLVLEHEQMPFVTLRAEWPAEALRRAALRHLDLSRRVLASGYGLKDAHTWNLLFRGPVPFFTDFGSIRPAAEMNWEAWQHEFRKYFLMPLRLFARGDSGLARAALREHGPGVGHWLVDHRPDALFGEAESTAPASSRDPDAMLAALQAMVEALTFPHETSQWTAYEQPGTGPATQELRPKDHLVAKVLDRLPFASAIDLGANRGLHARMCAARGAAVLACDIDEACLDAMFVQAERDRASILPLYVDVVWPLGPSGPFGAIPPAHERLRCDLVICLALVHHVCMRWQFAPSAFVQGIAGFTRRNAIVEFIPAHDWHVAQWALPIPPGYSSDGMQAALSQVFKRVERLTSEPAPRELFVCEGKR